MIINNLITNQRDVIDKVTDSINGQKSLLLTYLNQHCFNIYYTDAAYKEKLNKKFSVYQADQGMFLALKYLFGRKLKKIDATAMNLNILNELILKKIPLAIVGGNFDKKFVQMRCEERKIYMVGYQNGYFEENQTESIIKELNNFNTNVFIIGMGAPQQELFAEKLSLRSNNKVIICVGNFFEFYFGTKRRAPIFIRKIGFEWMFRLITEPRRLWNRYLLGIPIFFYKIFKLKITQKNCLIYQNNELD